MHDFYYGLFILFLVTFNLIVEPQHYLFVHSLMDFKEIATISGKGGLFRIVKPTRTGVILEALDKQKTRVVAGPQQRVSLLKEISMYTTTKEGSVALEDVLQSVFEKYGKETLPVNSKSEGPQLQQFLTEVLPDYDQDRIYASDIKKLVTWYGILVEHMSELFEKPKAEEVVETQESENKQTEEPVTQTEEPVAAEATKKSKKQATS